MTELEELEASLVKFGVPYHDHEGLINYVVRNVEPGSFLRAVLENDLMGACTKADSVNRTCLHEIVSWLWNVAPSPCWGSPAKVKTWLSDWRLHPSTSGTFGKAPTEPVAASGGVTPTSGTPEEPERA